MFSYKDKTINQALDELIAELTIFGYRERTIYDYRYHISRMCKGLTYLSEINRNTLLNYLAEQHLSDTTKLIRLKCVRSVLKKWYDRGLITDKIWVGIHIKVNEQPQDVMLDKDVQYLYNALDHNNDTEFRDITAILLMYETGVRIGTLTKVTYSMVDFDNLLITFDGGSMKNHKLLTLPISRNLAEMLRDLNNRNNNTNPLFQTIQQGDFQKAFSKRCVIYRDRYDIKTLKPHAIRRNFAKRLLDSGVNIAIISKALNHSDIGVTSKYLNISNEEVIDSLREFKRYE